MAKTWTEKFHNGKTPFVAPSIRKISGFPVGSQMLIPIPSQIDDYIRSIPRGEDRTVQQMSEDLAREAGAELTCPMCSGMFLRICAEKSYEEVTAGAPTQSVTPFWRMAGPKAAIRKSLSCGEEFLDTMRLSEQSPSD